jgi:hypothetical protein
MCQQYRLLWSCSRIVIVRAKSRIARQIVLSHRRSLSFSAGITVEGAVRGCAVDVLLCNRQEMKCFVPKWAQMFKCALIYLLTKQRHLSHYYLRVCAAHSTVQRIKNDAREWWSEQHYGWVLVKQCRRLFHVVLLTWCHGPSFHLEAVVTIPSHSKAQQVGVSRDCWSYYCRRVGE